MRLVLTFIIATALVVAGYFFLEKRQSKPIDVTPTALIELERLEGDEWRLSYTPPSPLPHLELGPPYDDMRQTHWQPEEGFVITRRRDEEGNVSEVLQREDKASFDAVSLTLTSYDAIVPKHYVPFNTFSDGGASVFIGQFIPDGLDVRFWFMPRQDEIVIAGGRPSSAPVLMPYSHDAFIYFGGLQPIETDVMLSVTDPSTPKWLREKLDETLPAIFDYFQSGFERDLTAKPSLYIAARFSDENTGYSIKGGALTNQLQMRIRGTGMQTPDPWLESYIIQFFAHEGAHLWQNLSKTSNETAWIHEGGADALALAAVSEIGFWDEAQVKARKDEAINACKSGLAETALAEAHRIGRFDLTYSCGHVIAMATEAGLTSVQPHNTPSITSFWRLLSNAAHGSENGYTLDLYLQVFEEQGGSPALSAAITSFLQTRHDNPEQAIIAFLAVAGLTLVSNNSNQLELVTSH